MLTRSLAALVAISSILESSSTLVAIPLVAKLVPRFETFFAGVPEPQPCRDQRELQKVFLQFVSNPAAAKDHDQLPLHCHSGRVLRFTARRNHA